MLTVERAIALSASLVYKWLCRTDGTQCFLAAVGPPGLSSIRVRRSTLSF